MNFSEYINKFILKPYLYMKLLKKIPNARIFFETFLSFYLTPSSILFRVPIFKSTGVYSLSQISILIMATSEWV